MKLNSKTLMSLAATLLIALGLVGETAAQTRPRNTGVRALVTRVRVQSDNFRESLDTALQTVRLRGTDADNLNVYREEYENALSEYENRLQARQAVNTDVNRVLDAAARINEFLRATPLGETVALDWSRLRTSLGSLASEYRITWNPDTYRNNNSSNFPNNSGSTNFPNDNSNRLPRDNRTGFPNRNTFGSSLTGTYRLDVSQSDDPREAARRAVNALPVNERSSSRDNLERRLESPTALAIEQRGQQISIASSRAPQVSFDANGRDRVETVDNNRSIRVRATLSGDVLEVSTIGDRGNDYNLTFEPFDAGRRLRVTRRLSTDFLRQPVTVTSVYEKTDERAQLDLFERPNNNTGNFPNRNPNNNGREPEFGRRDGEFVVVNNAAIIARLETDLSTKTSQNNDRFTMTVTSPTEYDGAIIEGYVTGLERSGRVSGRAQMNFNFERIRLRDGRSYSFAGAVESVRTTDGETIRVDNEGTARGGSQTTQTATRGAVGAGLGAIIGAIAGGGKGAAIGAIIGAGAGAGSVVVQGRDDLELRNGTEVNIRASAPDTVRTRQ